MKRMHDKVAVVTGGARGLGVAAVERLCEEGARVLFTDVLEAEGLVQLERLKGLGHTVAFEAQDVTEPERWGPVLDAAVSRWGRLDVLVNNAGVAIIADIEELTLAQWRKTLSVNLDGVFLGTQAAVSRLKAKGGSIVNVASIEGLVGEALIPAYNASKGAVRMFTKSVAIHCARRGYGIRVNNVCPGFADTQMVSGELARMAPADAQAFAGRVLQRTPMGRFATPAEIANAVLFLACDESSYLTGTDLIVDGGYTAG
jgi:NAD(P)-dependent dehydrogenase (short-subunit alcohol dehydrogenase family)